jgi:hypothetical protein
MSLRRSERLFWKLHEVEAGPDRDRVTDPVVVDKSCSSGPVDTTIFGMAAELLICDSEVGEIRPLPVPGPFPPSWPDHRHPVNRSGPAGWRMSPAAGDWSLLSRVGSKARRYTGGVSQPLTEPPQLPPATEEQVRSHAGQLVELAAEHGITGLAFASPEAPRPRR